ncbi:MAG: glycoside hydrolase family 130 protein [Tannerellaceae bacterium]|nr:glycoside hydrolase family 130 protein [Tannerellaceae bacterium]
MEKKYFNLALLLPVFLLCNCVPQKQTEPTPPPEFPEWALTGFERPAGKNPVLSPQSTLFDCPMQGKPIAWEESDTFNPAATIYNGEIVVLYRAEDNTAQGIGSRTSRIGYASSPSGVDLVRKPAPVLYPAHDEQALYEIPGGCEDPRVAMTEDGTYLMHYTQWNRETPRLAVATSKDLVNWTKHGPAFAKAHDGKFINEASKAASIITSMDGDRQVITKLNGKYFMYWGEHHIYAATSENLTDWEPLVDEEGNLLKLFSPRKGYFDSALTECGPPAIMTKYGILLFYNGKNHGGDNRDINYPANAYCAGQALFDTKDPTRVMGRLDKPFLQPTDDFEKSGQYPAGTVFIEGLVYHQNKWYLYYGCADSFVAVAISENKLLF